MRAEETPRGLIEASGQRWKIRLGLSIVITTGGSVLVCVAGLDRIPDSILAVVVPVSIGLCLATLLWLCLGVRCPRCRLSLFYFAFSHAQALDLVTWLGRESRCPRCGISSTDLERNTQAE